MSAIPVHGNSGETQKSARKVSEMKKKFMGRMVFQ